MRRSLQRLSVGLSRINPTYKPFPARPIPQPQSTTARDPLNNEELLKKHTPDDGIWDADKVVEYNKKYGITPWSMASLPSTYISHGEGVYLFGKDGKKILDFNAQAMCANLGHTIPEEILDAINKQLKETPMVYCTDFNTEIRARFTALLSDILPGDLEGFFFTAGGAEANESAVRMARLYSGKHKILTRHRSYHGGTATTLQMTGDARKHFVGSGQAGIVHFFDPFPYSFKFGETEEENCTRNLEYLRETIEMEGPQTIAAIQLEPVTGTNGVLIPPKGYLEGVRALCDEYDLLMICDEVMAGFGRTGKWFSFEHTTPCIVPDIVTGAKGINAAVLPLGMVAVRAKLRDHFYNNNVGTGSTYNSHPVTMASGYAAVRYMLKHNMVERVALLESVVQKEMAKLADKHPCVKQCRSRGLFGVIEFQRTSAGEPFGRYTEPMHPAIGAFKSRLLELGLFTFFRPTGIMHVNPPYIITEAQIKEAYAMIDQAVTEVLDPLFEG